jgi:hypothetical protein
MAEPDVAGVRPGVKSVVQSDIVQALGIVEAAAVGQREIGDEIGAESGGLHGAAAAAQAPRPQAEPVESAPPGYETQPIPPLTLACTRPAPTLRPLLGRDGFVVHGLLSAALSQALVDHSHALGYSFWNLAAPHQRDYRNADTVEMIDPRFAALLWQRLQPLVVSQVEISKDDDRWERGRWLGVVAHLTLRHCPRLPPGFEGLWQACGINEHMLFAPHRRLHGGGL